MIRQLIQLQISHTCNTENISNSVLSWFLMIPVEKMLENTLKTGGSEIPSICSWMDFIRVEIWRGCM